MTDPDIIGIIEVPLYTFTFLPNGRDEDEHAIDWLTSVFKKVRCRPELWDNHLKGYINERHLQQLLQELRCSEGELRRTIDTRQYPHVQTLRGCIVCLDGRQRIATARRKFGENYSWPVKLYSKPHIDRFLYETKDSDGEIYWNIRENKTEPAENFYTQLSPGKQSILKRLLKPAPDAFYGKREFLYEDIVRSLDSVFSFPGFRKQFLLGNMLKILSLRCPKEVSRYLQVRVVGAWHSIVGDNHQVVDYETVTALQRHVPSNLGDKAYIAKLMDGGRIFRLVRDPAARAEIKHAISKLNIVLPSMETFHENVSFFSVGVNIIRDVILDDALLPQDFGHATGESDSTFELLGRFWNVSDQKRAEIAQSETSGTKFGQLHGLQKTDASLLLFLSALRKFPYMTKDSPIQDRRKSRDVFLANDSGNAAFINRLCVVAHELGFDTDKVRQGVQLQYSPGNALQHNTAILTLYKPDAEYTLIAESNGYISEVDREALLGNETDTRKIIALLHSDVKAREWRSGRPPIRAFVELQKTAFLPILHSSDARYEITPAFILYDFLRAFFDFGLKSTAQSHTTGTTQGLDGDESLTRRRRRRLRRRRRQAQPLFHRPVRQRSESDTDMISESDTDMIDQGSHEFQDNVMGGAQTNSSRPDIVPVAYSPVVQSPVLVPIPVVQPPVPVVRPPNPEVQPPVSVIRRQPFSPPTQTFTPIQPVLSPGNLPPRQGPRTLAPVPNMQTFSPQPAAAIGPQLITQTSTPDARPRKVIPIPGRQILQNQFYRSLEVQQQNSSASRRIIPDPWSFSQRFSQSEEPLNSNFNEEEEEL